MKAKEFRELSLEELKTKEKQLRHELFIINQQRYGGKVEKPHMFEKLRKDIARIQTIINEKKSKN